MPERAKSYKRKTRPGVRLVKLNPSADGVRKTANARGYNYRWQGASKQYLNENPLCEECDRNGKTSEATCVDHIRPHRGNQALFWSRENWQALCDTCHNRKTGKGQ